MVFLGLYRGLFGQDYRIVK